MVARGAIIVMEQVPASAAIGREVATLVTRRRALPFTVGHQPPNRKAYGEQPTVLAHLTIWQVGAAHLVTTIVASVIRNE